jgi:excinuclease ABC subunit A
MSGLGETQVRQEHVIRVVGAREHNLQNITVDIPRGVLTVITGLSGSGKSSLAFDTIYAEGQRRYVESLSAYARQFLEQMQKPDVDRIEGLSPTIAIDQRVAAASPRSTVATTTEMYDFLRVLFARVGESRCPICHRPIVRQTTTQVVDAVMAGPEGQRILVLAPLVQNQRGGHKSALEEMIKQGFVRARIDGAVEMIEDIGPLAPHRKHSIDVVVDRLIIKPGITQRLADSIETATNLSGGRVVVAAEVKPGSYEDEGYSALLACPVHTGIRLTELSPRIFSFNSPYGACAQCSGLGTTLEFDPELIVPEPNLSLAAGAIAAWKNQGKRLNAHYAQRIKFFCETFNVLPDIPYRNIPEDRKRILENGTGDEDVKEYGAAFEGVIADLKKRWRTTESEAAKQRLHSFQSESPCEACAGARLRPEALWVKINDRSISEVTAMTVSEAFGFFDALRFAGEAEVIAAPLVRQIRERLKFMCEVGVDYLTLNRGSATLSGGEAQRIRLATQIGSGLAGVCYVLDEPTVGLHPRDSHRLADILTRLAEMENTVIVVEHDDQIISRADHIIDIGPGAGMRGGRIVAQGSLREVLECPDSITAKYLTGKRAVDLPEQRRQPNPDYYVEILGAVANNLKKIDVRFPLGCFICVTGVSGSGKSTLVTDILLRVLKRRINRSGPKPGAFYRIVNSSIIDKVIEIDQSPIGRTPRSTPATYVGVFDLIRQLYAKTREAKIRGYAPARFSFNVKGGRCEQCQGQGTKRIEMHFLPDVYVRCDACGGARYNRETLEVRYRGRNIADVLDMRVEEAATFFENFANICQRLKALKDVGLGYLSLGQSSGTLSGGEAQRVKLASELGKSAEGHTMYILDEPTTGLHFADVHALLNVLNRLADRGHTVVVIEHNLDVIKVADWIIDLGPEGGEGGGYIVAEGSPEQVADNPTSHTGRFLTDRLAARPPLADLMERSAV